MVTGRARSAGQEAVQGRAIPALCTAGISQIIVGLAAHPEIRSAPANGFQGQGHGWRNAAFLVQQTGSSVPADSQAGSEFVDAPAFGLQAIPETGGWMGWVGF